LNIDFALVLVVLVAVSGVVWAFDALFLASGRGRAVAALGAEAGAADREHAAKPPVVVDYARSFFPVFLAVLVLRSFIAEPFRIPSGSMMPTLLVGDFILVNKFGYGIRLPVLNTKVIPISDPQRGDVVVFRYPKDPSIPYIKRVIGLPGDTIRYEDKVVYVNGVAMPQEVVGYYHGVGYGARSTGASRRVEDLTGINHAILVQPDRGQAEPREWTVPEGHYFVLGDNRDDSTDSRFWGFVPDENLVGRAFVIWMNWDWRAGGVDFRRLGDWIE
jgi:signal peptidase I